MAKQLPLLNFPSFELDENQGKCPLPFRYPGGKHYALGILKTFWEQKPHDEYREPFVGGGSVFFAKPKVLHNWINDKDSELITTYCTMRDPIKRELLIERLRGEIASKERWFEIFNYIPKNDLDVAFKYYYLNRTSFSGKMVSPSWGYRDKRSLPPERWHERIAPVGKKLVKTKCTDLDFESVIDSPSLGESTLLYVDPPYFSPPKHKHYRHGFVLSDHERLCNTLRNTPHSFFLTYDDHPEVRKMYSWAHIYETRFFYRVDNSNIHDGSRREGFELIITNYSVSGKSKIDSNEYLNND